MGLLKRLFGSSKEVVQGPAPRSDPFEVISDCGAVLEAKAQTPEFVADEGKLPYPKDQIKKCIIHFLKAGRMPSSDIRERHVHEMYYLQSNQGQTHVQNSRRRFDMSTVLR